MVSRWDQPEFLAFVRAMNNCRDANHSMHADAWPRPSVQWKFRDYEQFFETVGRKPSKKHKLSRIDLRGNYEPGNVAWMLPKEEAENGRKQGLGNAPRAQTTTKASQEERGWLEAHMLAVPQSDLDADPFRGIGKAGALEMLHDLGFTDDEIQEGIASLNERFTPAVPHGKKVGDAIYRDFGSAVNKETSGYGIHGFNEFGSPKLETFAILTSPTGDTSFFLEDALLKTLCKYSMWVFRRVNLLMIHTGYDSRWLIETVINGLLARGAKARYTIEG